MFIRFLVRGWSAMAENLLIVGAGSYAVVALDIALETGRFEKIDFVDDSKNIAVNGSKVIGTIKDIKELACRYKNIIVAIGDWKVRLSLIRKIEEETGCNVISLVSPKAHVSKAAQVMKGCIVEPMAVVHTGCKIGVGCIISAGAVVNHESECCDGVHIDCNATVSGYSTVPMGMKVCSGVVFKNIN